MKEMFLTFFRTRIKNNKVIEIDVENAKLRIRESIDKNWLNHYIYLKRAENSFYLVNEIAMTKSMLSHDPIYLKFINLIKSNSEFAELLKNKMEELLLF